MHYAVLTKKNSIMNEEYLFFPHQISALVSRDLLPLQNLIKERNFLTSRIHLCAQVNDALGKKSVIKRSIY